MGLLDNIVSTRFVANSVRFSVTFTEPASQPASCSSPKTKATFRGALCELPMSSSRRAAGSETSSEAAQVRPARTSEQWTCLVSAGDVPSSATAGAALFAHVLCACSLSRVHAAADRPHRRVRARHRRRHHSRPRLHLLRVATRSSFGCAALIRLLAALAVRARRARACRARAGRARAGRARPDRVRAGRVCRGCTCMFCSAFFSFASAGCYHRGNRAAREC